MFRRGVVLCAAGLLLVAAAAGVARPGPGEVVPWEAHFRAVAGPLWVERAAQVWVESSFRADAVSPVGAAGPSQVMPATLRWWKDMRWVRVDARATDLPDCLVGQHRHMLWLRRYWQDLDRRLAAYNVGQGAVLRAEAAASELGDERPDAWLRRLPAETQAYVPRNAERRAAVRQRLRAAGVAE